MLKKIAQRLTDPVFYRKRWKSFSRLLRPESRPTSNLLSVENLNLCKRVLVVIAHPDDETFCSGLLCKLAEQGAQIRVLCLTRGEGGPTAGTSRTELGKIRAREMEKSCAILGVDEVEFLGYEDPTGWEYRTFAPRVSPAALDGILFSHLSRFQPCLVITHGSAGEYWHPAHCLVHSASLRAANRHRAQLDRPMIVATTNAWHPHHPLPELLNRDDRPHLYHRATTAQAERRLQALEAHRSQLALFEKFAGGPVRKFIDRTATEFYRLSLFMPAGASRLPFTLPRPEVSSGRRRARAGRR